MECPKCHSTRVEKTTLGSVEQIGGYAASVAGIAALKIGASMLGVRTCTPKWKAVKSGSEEIFPNQYRCLKCGNTFHSN